MGKDFKKPVILTLALMLSLFTSKAQGPECFFVHFDKSFYVSGEVMWFKVYRLDISEEAQSRILHVDLVNHQNQVIARQKLPIENGSSFGSMELPLDAKEGYYRFRAYTRYNFNFDPPVIYQANIPVYQLDKQEISRTEYMPTESTEPSGMAGISIITDKRVYSPRDSLEVSIQIDGQEVADKTGKLSISVVPIELVIPRFEFYHHLECPQLSPIEGPLILPERSLFIEGILQNPLTGQKVSSRLLSIYVDETSQLIRASSGEGSIRVTVPDFQGTGTFQLLNLDPYNPSVLELITETENIAEIPYTNPDLPRRTDRVLNYLGQLEKRRKIIELFDLYRLPGETNSPPPPKVPDAVYRTDGYTQIYSFEQFINEAIPNVRVNSDDSTNSVRLFNREQGRLFEDHPWYIVDGFLTFNETEVLQIPYRDIEEIRLYSRTSTMERFFQGFMFRSGVMEVITRDVKYVRELRNSPNVVEIEGFALPKDFHDTITLPKDQTTPDLRGVMYWSPNVFTNEQGAGQITVPLSDDTGEYAIVIIGMNNLGQPLTGYYTFEIQQQSGLK